MRASNLLLACLTAAGAATAVRADARSDIEPYPRGDLGGHVGFVKVRDAENGDLLGGVHLEIRPLVWIGVQGAVDYRSEERFAVQMGSVEAALHVRTIPITASGKLYLPVVPWVEPYGLVGAGWYHQVFDYSTDLEALGVQDRDVTTFGWHTGLGANLALAPRLGIYGEARWIFLDPDRGLDRQTWQQIEALDFDATYLAAGVNFHF